MKNTLARTITGKGKYTLQLPFNALIQAWKITTFSSSKTPKNINSFSLKNKYSSTIKSSLSAGKQNKSYGVLSEPNSSCQKVNTLSIHNRRNAVSFNITQLQQILHGQIHCRLAYGNACTGWERLHRSRGTQHTETQAVEQAHSSFTMSERQRKSLLKSMFGELSLALCNRNTVVWDI